MAKKKKFKKGTVIWLHTSCQYVGCESRDRYVLEDDMTEEELNDMAIQYAHDQIQVEGWFTLDESEDE